MTDYEAKNAYTSDYFPDSWSDEDMQFLSRFVREEFGASFVETLDGAGEDYDYLLYTRVDDDRR